MWLLWLIFPLALCQDPIEINSVISDDIPTIKHKVHNLELNPEQHSWCELKHIRQIVTHQHCEPKEMENYVCVGTCFSYSVPQTEPEAPGDEMLDYCDSCQPAVSHWTTVELNCESDGYDYTFKKNIQMISNCSCLPCNSHRKQESNYLSQYPDIRISELIYKLMPDTHRFVDKDAKEVDLTDDLRYTQVSLGDLKKEFNLDADQEKLLDGKLVMKDKASFLAADDDEKGEREYFLY